MEIWKAISGFDGYEVSNFGNVRCWNSQNGRGNKSKTPRLLNQSKFSGRPYLRVTLYNNGKPKMKRVHQLVLEAFIGECPDEMEACHNDGDASNNHLSNLRWDTRQANMDDQIKHGTRMRGEKCSLTTITEDQAKKVKEMLKSDTGYGSLKRVAKAAGVSYRAASEIKYNHSWRHI